jgi:hypothetical protein
LVMLIGGVGINKVLQVNGNNDLIVWIAMLSFKDECVQDVEVSFHCFIVLIIVVFKTIKTQRVQLRASKQWTRRGTNNVSHVRFVTVDWRASMWKMRVLLF